VNMKVSGCLKKKAFLWALQLRDSNRTITWPLYKM